MAIDSSSPGLDSLAKKFGLVVEDANGASTPNGDTKQESKPALASVGSLASFVPLYQGSADQQGNWTWVDKVPEDVEEAAENNETARHALIVRNKKCLDSRKKFEIHSIIVQSPWLKTALAEVLKGYPGVCCSLDRLEFNAPFEPFVHRWGQMLRFKEMKHDEKTTEHFSLLFSVLKEELKDTIKAFEDYVAHGVITYQHLWTIFQPGGIVFSDSHQGTTCALEFRNGKYAKTNCGNSYQLTCESIDWNGTNFGRSNQCLQVWEFSGTRLIKSLHSYPLSFHPEKEAVKALLIERGKKFESLAGYHYNGYEGFAVNWDREGKEMLVDVAGRMIVDAGNFRRQQPRYAPYIQPLKASEGVPESSETNGKEVEASAREWTNGQDQQKKRLRLTEDHHLICTPRVQGYSLKSKKWLLFYIDHIKDIKWNDNAFQSLVLPEDQKELILSFAESQIQNRQSFDDVISGKGKGIIMLLSGPPGVGKTLTAESLSENMHTPLYMMSAGDLGTNPDQVEWKLTNILEMISKWNAILLLDECDVFLEARSTHDLERNKLVSIFLRVLEYYEGIMFLTTNRVDNIDPAFQSRIHISMAYPDLSTESRRHIWVNFLEQLKQPHEFTEKDLDELATMQLNGRQIKNVLKTAQLLAARKKSGLKREFVDTVLAIERRRPGVAE